MSNIEKTEIVIYRTKDYSIFKNIEGNRVVNQTQVRKLKDSIKENGFLLSPVIVNENYEVIDGQHRIEAAKSVGSYVYFLKAKGYSNKHMIAFNLNQKNWTKIDWMKYYAERGYRDYIELKRFMNSNECFTIGACIKLLQNNNSNPTRAQKYSPSKVGMNAQQVFEEGTWKCDDIDKAYDWADRIKRLKKYYKGYKREGFVSLMIALFRNDNFEFNEFERKLEIQPSSLVDCANRDQYLLLIEDIYNWRNRNKVNLRFSE